MEYLNTILSSIELILKIIIVALCGLLIGIIKKPGFKPADRKILVIIAMSTCVIMATSSDFSGYSNIETGLDSSLLAASVILAVAVIAMIPVIKRKGSNDSIAIAVSLWMAGTIGITIGSGLYFIGVITTIFTYFIFSYPYMQAKMKDQRTDSM